MKLKYTQLQIFLEIAGIVLVAGMVAYVAFNWNTFPERVPTHFGASGQADAWGSKGDLLFLPIIGICLYALITVVSFFPGIWNMNIGKYKEENKVAVYQTIKTMIMLLKVEVLANFLYIFTFMSAGKNLPPFLMPVFLVVILGSIVLFILRARKVGNKQEGDY